MATIFNNYFVDPLKFFTSKSGIGSFVSPMEGSNRKYSNVKKLLLKTGSFKKGELDISYWVLVYDRNMLVEDTYRNYNKIGLLPFFSNYHYF